MASSQTRRTTSSKQEQSTNMLSECKRTISHLEHELDERNNEIKQLNKTIQMCKDDMIKIKGCANRNKPMYRTPSGAVKALEDINDIVLDMLRMLVERKYN